MSLDVYLYREEDIECPECKHVFAVVSNDEVYWANITHNLARMAAEAGAYEALWHPEKIGAKKAGDITRILAAALALLESCPERFTEFNASNGWGVYEEFVLFVRRYLEACEQNPHARIEVSV